MQDCSNSSALEMVLLQPCTKPSIYGIMSSYYSMKNVYMATNASSVSTSHVFIFGVQNLLRPVFRYQKTILSNGTNGAFTIWFQVYSMELTKARDESKLFDESIFWTSLNAIQGMV